MYLFGKSEIWQNRERKKINSKNNCENNEFDRFVKKKKEFTEQKG